MPQPSGPWAVSFGFMWVAFGVLFSALAVLAPASATDARGARQAVLALLATWVFCWAPHLIIAVAVAVGGMDSRSMARYGAWASRPAGALTLSTDGVLLARPFLLSASGFVLAFRDAFARLDSPSQAVLSRRGNA